MAFTRNRKLQQSYIEAILLRAEMHSENNLDWKKILLLANFKKEENEKH